MKMVCGGIGLRFLVLRDGLSLIVLRCGTRDIGSLRAVTRTGNRSRCMRQVHVGESAWDVRWILNRISLSCIERILL